MRFESPVAEGYRKTTEALELPSEATIPADSFVHVSWSAANLDPDFFDDPFFLAEVVNLLSEEERLDDSVSDIALPDGVREALGRRLDRLSAAANELLTTVSIVGREFEYETLKLVTDQDDDALLGLLDEI